MRYHTMLISIIMVSVFAFVAGCKKTSNANPPAFMQVGHQWVYLEGFAGGGFDTLTVQITGIDSKNEYEVTYTHSNGVTVNEYWYMDGNYVKQYAQGFTNYQSNIFWSVNAAKGDKWNSPLLDSLGQAKYGVTQYDQVIGVNTVDTTLAGIFNTTSLQVSNSGNNKFEFYYMSNDAGELSQGGLYTLNLISKNF